MRYKTQAIIGIIGAVCCGLGIILSYIYLTESTGFWWVIPAFLIPFAIGFSYYAYASMKEKRQKRQHKEERDNRRNKMKTKEERKKQRKKEKK